MRSPSGLRHDEGADDEVGGLAFANRPAGQALVVEVFDAGEVELAVAAMELGDVGDPTLVGAFGGEVALQQVRRRRRVSPTLPPLPAGVGVDEATLGHDPRQPFPGVLVAMVAELALDARSPVGAS